VTNEDGGKYGVADRRSEYGYYGTEALNKYKLSFLTAG